MRQIGRIIVNAMLLLAMAAGEAAAGPLEDGEAACRHGEYPTAVQLLVPLAEQGNVAAQVTLGDMYVIGQGVLKDGVEAAKWYRKAADQGSLKAQIDLARCSNSGASWIGTTSRPRNGWVRLRSKAMTTRSTQWAFSRQSEKGCRRTTS
jgi:TPR repeat protein